MHTCSRSGAHLERLRSKCSLMFDNINFSIHTSLSVVFETRYRVACTPWSPDSAPVSVCSVAYLLPPLLLLLGTLE